MRVITLYADCPHGCDGQAETRIGMLDQDANDPIRIDVEMLVGQTDLECTICGCTFWTGDVDLYDPREGEGCPAGEDDEEDDHA